MRASRPPAWPIAGPADTPPRVTIAAKMLDDLGWPTYVDHWVRRCATARGAAAVRGFVLFGERSETGGGELAGPAGGAGDSAAGRADAGDGGIAAARDRAREITEARGLAAR